MQIFGVYMQINGFGNVTYLSHLGGLAVGLSAALAYKELEKRKMTAAIKTAE